jgi:hypothetical protein
MVYFAFLAGVFFSDPDAGARQLRRRSKRRTGRLDEPEEKPAVPSTIARGKPPPDQIPNPFAD